MAEALSRFTSDAWKRGVVVGAATRTGRFCNVPLPRQGQKRSGIIQVGHYSREDIKRCPPTSNPHVTSPCGFFFFFSRGLYPPLLSLDASPSTWGDDPWHCWWS